MHLIVISGMLGAGKTSVMMNLIRQLTEKGYRLAVIENDFGNKGVDSGILQQNGIEVRELEGGCVCCTMKTGMIDTLRFLQDGHDPQVVLIEPTGIADPSYILNSVTDISGLTIDRISIITVVDSERYLKMKSMFERMLKNQLVVADIVLINKTDTQPAEALDEIESSVRSFSFDGPILRVQAEQGVNMGRIPEMISL